MCKESRPIPIDRDTEEVQVRVKDDGSAELVLIGEHSRDVVPVRLAPATCDSTRAR